MSQIDPNSDTLAGDTHVESADGQGAVNPDTLTLAELNSFLGKDFKDKESALKSVKETFSFVGKRREDILKEATVAPPVQNSDSELKAELQKLQQDLFYTNNPQFKEYRDVISTMGGNPAEVVESDVFKKVYAKVKVADEAEQSKSIVSSSNRLASNPSTFTKAVQIANSAGTSTQTVAEELAAAVLSTENQ